VTSALSDVKSMIKYFDKQAFSDSDIADTETKNAMNRLEDMRKKVISALTDYTMSSVTPPEDKKPFLSYIMSAIHCPVDFTVYDKNGTELGYVRNGEIYYDDSIYIETYGDVKYLYVPKGLGKR